MTAPVDPDVMHRDVSEEQSRYREEQRAADEQRWLADQRRMLREMARQGWSL